MSLFTKSILSERETGDGVRISVMSRHTLADGVTPDSRIDGKYDEHLVELAPDPKLIGAYYKRNLPWEIFERRYLEQIKQIDLASVVQVLASRALRRDLTLLCIELTEEQCHRRLLAEECLGYEPSLKVEHR